MHTDTAALINSTNLAERLGVNRSTVCRWRHAGYLPAPCYADGAVSLWALDDIERWEAAGRPWADQDLARRRVAERGAEWLQGQINPEPTGLYDDSPDHARLVEELEATLNRAGALVQQLESAGVADRFALLRQAIAKVLGDE